MKENEFHYTYSAPTENEKREIRNIRSRYEALDPHSEKMARLRKLDSAVQNTPTAFALVAGILGCLLFGLGLSLALEWQNYLLGSLLSAVGFLPMLAAFPLYNVVYKHMKKKHGEEILRLTEELLESESENSTR